MVRRERVCCKQKTQWARRHIERAEVRCSSEMGTDAPRLYLGAHPGPSNGGDGSFWKVEFPPSLCGDAGLFMYLYGIKSHLKQYIAVAYARTYNIKVGCFFTSVALQPKGSSLPADSTPHPGAARLVGT